MMNKSYFYVIKSCGAAPKHRHETQQEALQEAKRLAEMNPQVVFTVCRALLEVKFDKNPYRIKQLGKRRDHKPCAGL